MGINWNEAPEGATHHVGGTTPNWYKETDPSQNYHWWDDDAGWEKSNYRDIVATYREGYTITPRPTEPKPYTRDEALHFLVERLDSWPTDIADAPLCPGWGWTSVGHGNNYMARTDDFSTTIYKGDWRSTPPVWNVSFDWNDAPQGTTHHIATLGPVWFKCEGDVLYMWMEGRYWHRCTSPNVQSWADDGFVVTPRPDFVPFVSVEDAQPATAKQPAPSGKGDPILGMVLADLTNRALEGREKYGEALKANNGRNALWDAYQEALDLAMYLRQAIEEQSK